ncbi:MAG: hypothetical protein JNJ58_07330 [Chitinophagaceae bacterium]|nr:hypothetical protein [Chitinophagaceae bacterium]
MTGARAKLIGSKYAFISIGIGLFVAQLIMSFFSSSGDFFSGFFWFVDFDYLLNILIGVGILFLCGHYFGRMAGYAILIKKYHYLLTGFLCGISILFVATLLASCMGLLQEWNSSAGDWPDHILDYVVKPLYWVMFFGCIPVLVVGAWFGRRIQKQGEKEIE